MKGTPRSVWLSWMNRAAGWWTSAAVTAMQNQQRAALKAAKPKKVSGKAKPKRKRR
jgi:hypothetical protein